MYRNRKYRANKAQETGKILTPINENISAVLHPPTKLQRIDNVDELRPQLMLLEEDDIMLSQEFVPASQPPTQMRYFSQRSTQIGRTQCNINKTRTPNSYFEMVLMKCGADLDQPENYVLSCDHITFVNNFRLLIKKHQDFPENVQAFVGGFTDILNNENTELKLLTGCSINIPSNETTYQSQDSMIMNFLLVDFLQKDIIDALLKRIEYYAQNDQSSNMDVPILSMLLSQFKFVSQTFGDHLYDKIIALYGLANAKGKQDIISNAEFVFNPIKHDNFVNFLITNADSIDDLLSSNNVQTFTNLYLSADTQKKLTKKILDYIVKGTNLNNLPFLMKFLLKAIQEEDDSIADLIKDLRCCLDWNESSLETLSLGERRKLQIGVFTYIKQGLIRSKKFYDVWLKSIQNLTIDDTKPIDMVIFLMLISIREDKSHHIENLIRRQVKLERITDDIVSGIKTKYLHALDLYGDVLLQILQNFLKEKNLIVCNFAKQSYTIFFEIDESHKKKILNKLVELTCNKSSCDIITSSLEVLKNLSSNFAEQIQNYGMLLLPLLDQINEMNLIQSRIVMELLCSIAYPLPPLSDCPTLQDHIDMLVKKQICNRTTVVKKQGIIGTVQIINHIVRTENCEHNYELNESYETVNNLPEGKGKQAAKYITRILSATNYCTETLALFYDELAIVFLQNYSNHNNAGIDRYFLKWLSDLITSYFENKFVIIYEITNESIYIDGVELSFQKCINENDLDDSDYVPIGINISKAVLKPSLEALESITVLPALFNLMFTLQSIQFNGNLESIDALLGCPLLLPTLIDPDEHENDVSNHYDENTLKKIIDIYFHSVNWFRMIIGAFASQNDPDLRKKVLHRISYVIQLETLIKNLLTKAPPNYLPPVCDFSNTNNFHTLKHPMKRARKPVKNKNNIPTENQENEPGGNTEGQGMSFLATAKTQNKQTQNKRNNNNQNRLKTCAGKYQFEGSYGSREIYRVMSPNIMLILREKLDTEYPLPENKMDTHLGLLQLRFLLYDLVIKIESINDNKKLSSDHQNQHISNPLQLMNKSKFILPILFANLHELENELSVTLDKVNGVLGNAELFTDRLNYLKVCFGLCLRFISGYFSYSGFTEVSKKNYLISSLQSITNLKNENLSELSAILMEKLFAFKETVIDIKSGAHLYHTLSTLSKFTKNDSFDKKIRDLCKTFLCRKWHSFDGGLEKGANCNILLDELIKGFLNNSNLKRLLEISKMVLNDCKLLQNRDDTMKTFPNIYKGNFPMFFKRLIETLITFINNNVSNVRSKSELETLKFWEKSCEMLNKLLEIVQSLKDVPRNYILFLKYSNLFIKIFLQRGLPQFETSLRKNPERFNEILRNLQVITRFLHNLCCHSKAIKNSAIISQIPFIRETVENLVFKVKATLAGNKCSQVFWMGPLKNKDLSGTEIPSQSKSLSINDDDDTNSEEEISNDDSWDETILNGIELYNQSKKVTNDSNEASRSECF